jgi:hypothetical protein
MYKMMYKNKSIRILLLFLMLLKTQISTAQQFETMLRKAYTLLSIAQERERLASEKLDDIKNRRIRAEEDFVDAQETSKLSKKEKSDTEKQIKLLRKQEEDIQKSKREANQFLSEVTDIIKAPEKKRYKYITDYEKKAGTLEGEVATTTPSETPLVPNADPVSMAEKPIQSADKALDNNEKPEIAVADELNPEKATKKSQKDPKKESSKIPKKSPPKKNSNTPIVTKQYAKYNAQNDVSLNPPAADCRLAFDGIDNFTQRKRRETSPQTLFRHTEDFMRATLAKDKEYINCDVTASRIQGGFYYINLSFTILTKEAQKSFGFLDKGTSFVFKLTNGRIITLTNSKTDIGVVDNTSNATVYKAQLQINSSDVKAMTEAELDIFRVAWSAGYEDYEIYNMDTMQNIMRCLDKENK